MLPSLHSLRIGAGWPAQQWPRSPTWPEEAQELYNELDRVFWGLRDVSQTPSRSDYNEETGELSDEVKKWLARAQEQLALAEAVLAAARVQIDRLRTEGVDTTYLEGRWINIGAVRDEVLPTIAPVRRAWSVYRVKLRLQVRAAKAAMEEARNGVMIEPPRGPRIDVNDVNALPHPKYQTVLRRASEASLAAIRKLMRNTNPKTLGQGKDVVQFPTYNAIEPIGVYDIVYPKLHSLARYYMVLRETETLDGAACSAYGPTPLECVRTDKVLAKVATEAGMPELNEDANEKLLMHGTGAGNVLSILSTGFRTYNPGAYGDALYMAEDAGKTDQYARMEGSEELCERLGIARKGGRQTESLTEYKEVFFMIVSRVLLGCAQHVSTTRAGGVVEMRGLDGGAVYEQGKDGVRYLVLPYDSVIVEHGSTVRGKYDSGRRYREFLVQEGDRVLPVMLVAYVRALHHTEEPEFDPSVIGC